MLVASCFLPRTSFLKASTIFTLLRRVSENLFINPCVMRMTWFSVTDLVLGLYKHVFYKTDSHSGSYLSFFTFQL